MTEVKKWKSETYRIPVACCNLKIIIGYKKEKIYDISVMGSKIGGCKASLAAIGELTTELFRAGLEKEAIDRLSDITCPACSRKKGELNKEDKKTYPDSCPDALSRILQKKYDKDAKE